MAAKNIKLILIILMIMFSLMSTSFAAVRTFRVQENDFVKITPVAVDPDNDNIVYYFSPPFDNKGEWQTDYDDAGDYEIKITASDGINQTVERVSLIVENKNQPPQLKEKKIVVKETQEVNLKEFISDPDNDPLQYTFSAPFDDDGRWKTDYESAGSFVSIIIIDDGEFKVKEKIEVEVLNTNQPPTIINSFFAGKVYDFEEDENLEFFVDASDSDYDPLTYLWLLDNETVIGEEKKGKYYFDYNSAGDHSLKVTVKSGISEVSKEWTVHVANVNRRPEFELLPLTVNEGEKIFLDLPDIDLDGDTLNYSFEKPLDNKGEWQTDFNDAGTYKLEVIASDGQLTATEEMKITVLDVDQEPVLNLPPKLEVKEGEELSLYLDVSDPDGDNVTIKFKNLPQGADYNEISKLLSWEPDFNTIKRKGGLFSNVLNALRLEHYFLNKMVMPLGISACSSAKCTSGDVDLVIYNVNQAPAFRKMGNLSFTETELVKIQAKANDPDNDLIRYSYSSPLNKRSGEWQTDYDDEGEYLVYITVTDGHFPATMPVNVKVLKKNRQPELIIKKEDFIVNENDELMFNVEAVDPDNDQLEIRVGNFSQRISFKDSIFTWKPDYDTVINQSDSWVNDFVSNFAYLNKRFNTEKKVIWLEFIAEDEEFEVVHPVKVTVKNVNRKPEIIDFYPFYEGSAGELTATIGQELTFQVIVKDADDDLLNYSWSFGLMEEGVKGTNTITRTFTYPGQKKVKVKISDGRDQVEKEWLINVLGDEPAVTEAVGKEIVEEPFTVKVYVLESS